MRRQFSLSLALEYDVHMPANPHKQPWRISVQELLLEYVVPVIGGILAFLLATVFGVTFWWALLLALVGSFVFQWLVAGILMGLVHFTSWIAKEHSTLVGRRNDTALDWLAHPIVCSGNVVCPGIDPDQPLLPQRLQIIFRLRLLYNAWQANACDGRQMAPEDVDRMEDFEERFRSSSGDENSLRRDVMSFKAFLPVFLTQGGTIDVPERAVEWTTRDIN